MKFLYALPPPQPQQEEQCPPPPPPPPPTTTTTNEVLVCTTTTSTTTITTTEVFVVFYGRMVAPAILVVRDQIPVSMQAGWLQATPQGNALNAGTLLHT